jgi:hypothetical protein
MQEAQDHLGTGFAIFQDQCVFSSIACVRQRALSLSCTGVKAPTMHIRATVMLLCHVCQSVLMSPPTPLRLSLSSRVCSHRHPNVPLTRLTGHGCFTSPLCGPNRETQPENDRRRDWYLLSTSLISGSSVLDGNC